MKKQKRLIVLFSFSLINIILFFLSKNIYFLLEKITINLKVQRKKYSFGMSNFYKWTSLLKYIKKILKGLKYKIKIKE